MVTIAVPSQDTNPSPMEQAVAIFLDAVPGLTPARLLAGDPPPVIRELAAQVARIQGAGTA